MKSSVETKKELDELIKRGVRITVYTQQGMVHRQDQDAVDSMHETFTDYHNWKVDVRDFFLKYNFEDEADLFFEGDGIPLLKGGLEYSDIETLESKELLKKIREETNKKLTFLRDFSKKTLQTLPADERKKPTIELSFPEKVQWEKVMFKIKEGLQEVEIFYNNKHIKTADYKQLGFFTGKKQKKQDRQWRFLCALSVLSATDITLATADKMRDMVVANSTSAISTENVHQIKRGLVKRLCALFKTDDNPFHNRRDYYEPKFKILPESALRREEIWLQGGRLNENIAYEDNEEEAL